MTEYISKSEQKRRFKQVEEAAVELSLLGESDLQNLPVEEVVKEEIRNCRGIKGGARKRQIKYLAKMIREYDAADGVLNFLSDRKGSKLKENILLHEAEHLRDILINEALECKQYALEVQEPFSPDSIAEIANIQGGKLHSIVMRLQLNEHELCRLLYQYAQTRVHNHYREVFRMIKAGLEDERRNR